LTGCGLGGKAGSGREAEPVDSVRQEAQQGRMTGLKSAKRDRLTCFGLGYMQPEVAARGPVDKEPPLEDRLTYIESLQPVDALYLLQ
jgi:hypothetical protein